MPMPTDQPPTTYCEDQTWWEWWTGAECVDDPDRGIIDETLRDAAELADAASESIDDLITVGGELVGDLYDDAGNLLTAGQEYAGDVYDAAGNLITAGAELLTDKFVDPAVDLAKFGIGATAAAALGVAYLLFGRR